MLQTFGIALTVAAVVVELVMFLRWNRQIVPIALRRWRARRPG